MVNDRNDAKDRYSNQHAKFIVVDDRLLLVSSENFSPDSMPDDDKSDGTLGRRGTALVSRRPGSGQPRLRRLRRRPGPAAPQRFVSLGRR
jgi:hypothetical protein